MEIQSLEIQVSSSSRIVKQILELQIQSDETIKNMLDYLHNEDFLIIPIAEIDVQIRGKKMIPISTNLRDFGPGKIYIKLEKKTKIKELVVQILSNSKVINSKLELKLNDQWTIGQIINYMIQQKILEKSIVNQVYIRTKDKRILTQDFCLKDLYSPTTLTLWIQAIDTLTLSPKKHSSTDEINIQINLVDGLDNSTFLVSTNITDTFNDFRYKLYKHIQLNKLAENWSQDEEMRILQNNKPFTKLNMAFLNLVKDRTDHLQFTLIRIYPGGL